MERFAEWFWIRTRHHVLAGLGAVAVGFVNLSIVPLVIVVMAWYFGLSVVETLITAAVASGVVAAVFVASLSTMRSLTRPLVAWGRREPVASMQVWNASLQLTEIIAVRACVMAYVLHLATTVPLLARYGHMSWESVVGTAVALVPVLGAVGLITALGMNRLLEPMVREISCALPAGAVPAVRTWRIRARFLVGVGVGCFLSGGGVGAVVVLAHTPDSRFLSAMGAAIVLSAYMVVLFNWGLVTPTLAPLGDLGDATTRVRRGEFSVPVVVRTADELGQLAGAFNEMQVGLREREALHAAFGSYVDPALAQRMLSTGSSVFEGEEVDVTVMFADVRSFTTYSEGVSPAEAVHLLNRLFEVMVPVIQAHDGHVNHYLGDGLLAVFGAPQPLERHADAAVAAAVEIQERVREVLGEELQIGIGINTGPVIAGTVGGAGRWEFTVIGDTVNTGARVEALTKETGDAILVTDATRLALSRPRPRSAKRGEFEVRGKAAKVTLHALNPIPRMASGSTR